MTTDQYIKELEEFIKCREAATQGEWIVATVDSVESWHEIVTPGVQAKISSGPTWSNPSGITACESRDNHLFIAEAANKSADIARNLIEALKVIEEISITPIEQPKRSFKRIARDLLAKLNGIEK